PRKSSRNSFSRRRTSLWKQAASTVQAERATCGYASVRSRSNASRKAWTGSRASSTIAERSKNAGHTSPVTGVFPTVDRIGLRGGRRIAFCRDERWQEGMGRLDVVLHVLPHKGGSALLQGIDHQLMMARVGIRVLRLQRRFHVLAEHAEI